MTTEMEPPARDRLSQGEAEARAARVSEIRYELDIGLRAGAPTYRGEARIHFALSGDEDLFLDFRGRRIHTLEVNGRALEPSWNGYRLILPGAWLAPRTTVVIRYENEYDRTGDGLHHFTDPEDGAEYLYTNFEPYEAHRLFPSFDQPDLKAEYRLTVTAPDEWLVISASRAASRRSLGDGLMHWRFEPTARFSTYLFSLIAGPYAAFHDAHGDLPLGIYCRRSLARHLDPDEIFEVTKQGMTFYGELFDRPYPFTKYDQIFVPEFNAGAMENVGAVTFYEKAIFRDPPTETQRLDRAEVILHELAHMWFGNLVTMRWWNDIWLNESFATYIAYLAAVEATRFTSAWKVFHSGMKRWAYRQDQLVTTHPIACEAPDTDAAFLNFDGISYGKGAAVIKQLVAAIGLEGFRDGMRIYFRRHAFDNATLADFLRALEEGSGRALGEWARLWLETASLNTLTAEWRSDAGRLRELRLRQTAPEAFPFLRPHTVEVALVRETNGTSAIDALPARIESEEEQVADAAGRPAPRLVFPNHNDHAYAKVALDDASLGYLHGNIDRIADPLLRMLLWGSLWEMVRDRQLRSTDYLALVCEKLALEPDLELVEAVLARVSVVLAQYVPEARREAEAHAFFEAALRALRDAPAGDAQIIWARALVDAAITPEGIASAIRLADGVEPIPGLTIDQELRWTIAIRAVARGLPAAAERVAEERRRDPSDRGQRAEVRAAVARADASVKEEAWRRIHAEGYGSLHLTDAAMSGFRWPHQTELLEPYVERFFESVPGIFDSRDQAFASHYFTGLFPAQRVERTLLERSERLLGDLGEGSPVLARMLREANDDLARAIACRDYAAGTATELARSSRKP